jgi:vacuolar-type H+-ATPase catalytic subunit A/Vma1
MFTPDAKLKKGDLISGGDFLGIVNENSLFKRHMIMADPKASGRVVEVFDAGKYTVSQPVVVIEDVNGK